MLKLVNRKIFQSVALRCVSYQNVNLPEFPELDVDYLTDSKNQAEIATNIQSRKGVGNIQLVLDLKQKLDKLDPKTKEFTDTKQQFHQELFKIPNRTHPAPSTYKNDFEVIKTVGQERNFEFKPREFHEITKRLNMVRTEQLGNMTGTRSYYILGELAELEQALIKFSITDLLRRGFKLISVPDLLDRRIIESCGMSTTGNRNQVYSLDKHHGIDLCLSGTSEMAIAGFLANKNIPEKDLPLKLTTVSRCYRAETSSIAEEKGIYRVHHFTKVEMFGVTTAEHSESMLEEFRSIEEENFSSLGLHLRTIDMAPHELGAPAYRKYDVEAWLPGRKIFGEVSSCSNCTDYQSRRLGIKSGGRFVHTLNGTACAIPRMLIALVETYQNDNGTVSIPEKLRKFMQGKEKIGRQKAIPELKLVKNKKMNV